MLLLLLSFLFSSLFPFLVSLSSSSPSLCCSYSFSRSCFFIFNPSNSCSFLPLLVCGVMLFVIVLVSLPLYFVFCLSHVVFFSLFILLFAFSLLLLILSLSSTSSFCSYSCSYYYRFCCSSSHSSSYSSLSLIFSTFPSSSSSLAFPITCHDTMHLRHWKLHLFAS